MTLRDIGEFFGRFFDWVGTLGPTFMQTINEVPFLDWHIWVVIVYAFLILVIIPLFNGVLRIADDPDGMPLGIAGWLAVCWFIPAVGAGMLSLYLCCVSWWSSILFFGWAGLAVFFSSL